MSLYSSDNIESLTSKYKLEIGTNSINEELTCILCDKLMIDAYQTYCGCQYCGKCIVVYLTEEDKYCRGSKDECKEERLALEKNVFKNAMLNKKILKARVHCPNKLCPCIIELIKVEEHLKECGQQEIECPFSIIGCDTEGASKNQLLNHLQDYALMHSQLLIELIHNLKNEINGLKENFRISKLEISNLKDECCLNVKEEMEEQRENINKQNREIENQKKETYELKQEIESLKGESNKREIQMDEYRLNTWKQGTEIENQKKDSKKLKNEIERLKSESRKREAMLEGVKKEVTILKKEMMEVRECSRNIKNTVETSERESVKYQNETRSALSKMKEETDSKESSAIVTQSIENVRTRVDKLAKTVAILNVGTNTKVAVGQLSFTVDKFSTRKTSEEKILTPYFYSHTNGYKLRLLLYPGGRGGVRGTHLSVFFHVCRGEYDDVLPWPCRHTFTICIIDQRNGGTHVSVTYTYATSIVKHFFDKPMKKDNDGRGRDTLVSHEDLQSEVGLVVDDSIIVRCVVTAPSLSENIDE